MDRERFQRLDQLLQAALAVDPSSREAFVDQACAGDAALKAELLLLLAPQPNTGALVDGVQAVAAAMTGPDPSLGELPSFPGYRVLRRIGAGGMGVVYEAYDPELGRTLAIKAISGPRLAERDAMPHHDRELARFLDEAQVTGQLDHPGVVPVYALGRDPALRVYFSMRLVSGRTAHEVFALAREQREGWSLTKALEVVLKICDTLAYAHEKGVIHRDLKPANVMIGRFGEVYVMDWGLAKVVGQPDPRDLRLAPQPAAAERLPRVRTDRSTEAASDPDSSLVTMDGAVLGTPSYMPPEQAQGLVEELDARSDVYAVGACLYTLLTGWQPHVRPGTRPSAYAILERVRVGPPEPVPEIDPTMPAELVAICDKAMARDPVARYATMPEMAEDLRAFLGDRVVKAYRTGAWVELRKWIKRNRGMAAGLVAAFVTTVLGAVGIGFYALRADQKTAEARQNLDHFLQLADVVTLRNLMTEAAALWPEVPDKLAAMDEWLRRARQLIGHRPHLEGALREVAAKGHLLTPVEQQDARLQHPKTAELAQKRERSATLERELADLRGKRPEELAPVERDRQRGLVSEAEQVEQQIVALEGEIEAAVQQRFDMPSDQFLYDTLNRLVRELRTLEDPQHGAIALVEERRTWAGSVRERTIAQEQAAWDAAIASIANRAECSQYEGLRLRPQLGLVPLGRNRDSGLWEFWHPRTGARPEQDATGRYVIGEQTGLVFVLLPGGTFWMGAQHQDKNGQNYDPQAGTARQPVHSLTVAAFFLSKYEMTQGQWQRFAGTNPSYFKPGMQPGRIAITLCHPVESVSFLECARTLRQLGLRLPTEAQWEYACRAGTSTPWSTGDSIASLRGFANIADEGSKRFNIPGWKYESAFADGYTAHAPVGTYRPNGFGLHDMHGNVLEWCADDSEDSRTIRGGSFNSVGLLARSAARSRVRADHTNSSLGCRACLEILE